MSYNEPLKIVQEENYGEIDDRLIVKFILGWDEGCLVPNPEYVVGIGLYASKMPCVPVENETMVYW